ncbi:hypothetical protein [Hyunsoonleella pacifica]|uniref:Uncharacterized protein n=1 Tax=Hyunsoonleella pacifica TaxID=1080224 RepID=A0A4Q9FP28_9FLAO|nr:hypothetical protein [Hyunsoonleella pacifica]TBN15754.1 hypothetical protein EYD46_11575 [Hyunsoonleella pacifica]GGD22334.1 hypothetical protein GCM10011368_25530 [Hyunsoonleella pacifica]
MKTEELILVKKVDLKNNCPECFSKDGLQLTFKQKFVETAFYKSITNSVSHEIFCNTCNSIIYPERWTDDIERVFEYHKKAFTPKSTSKSFKNIFWILLIAGLAISFTLAFLAVFNLE